MCIPLDSLSFMSTVNGRVLRPSQNQFINCAPEKSISIQVNRSKQMFRSFH
jgi:hypothetical protein